MSRYVALYRVSTTRQGESGHGLEAQRAAVEAFVSARRGEIIAAYTEVESGKRIDRPALQQAIERTRLTGATLVIAKLCRLSRNAAYLLALRDSGVKIVVADMPEANDLTIGIMAVVAQAEREAISRRTVEALQAAKRRGVRLGNPNGARALLAYGKGHEHGTKTVIEKADGFAQSMHPLIAEFQAAGMSLAAMAKELNKRQIVTRRGGQWHPTTVANLIERLG